MLLKFSDFFILSSLVKSLVDSRIWSVYLTFFLRVCLACRSIIVDVKFTFYICIALLICVLHPMGPYCCIVYCCIFGLFWRRVFSTIISSFFSYIWYVIWLVLSYAISYSNITKILVTKCLYGLHSTLLIKVPTYLYLS